jgi:hypothetical protein
MNTKLAPQIPQNSRPTQICQPTFLRTKVRAPFARAAITLNTYPLPRRGWGGLVTSPGNAVVVLEPSQTEPHVIPQNISAPSRLRRILFTPVKFLWGMALCQRVLGALAVIGWTYRLMQRSVLKQ